MRILLICNKAPYPANDGSSIAIYNMARGFIANNCDLTLLTVNTKKHFKPDANVPEDFRIKSNYTSIYQNTSVTPWGLLTNLLFSSKSYFVSRFYFSSFKKALKKLLEEKSFDIIQLEGIFMGDYLQLIRKYSSAKIAIRTHNVEFKIWERMIHQCTGLKRWYLNIQNKRLKKYELELLPTVDAIIPITAVDKSILESNSIKNNFYVCPTGLNCSEYPHEHHSEIPNSVFHFGSMDWMPNEEAVIWFLEQVWDKVIQSVPEAKCYIAGRGISNRVKSIIKPSVIMHGEVKSSSEFYQSMQIMVVPLLSGSGMRIKIVEGLAYGKAIVSTSIGAEGIPVENGKHCIIADEPESFAKGVITLLKNKEQCHSLQLNGRKFAEEHFDNSILISGLINFYKSLISA